MAIRLNKTTKIILAIVILILSVALGYLIWRINQPERLDPTDSDAAYPTCPGGCNWNVGLQECIGGRGCVSVSSTGCPSGLVLKGHVCCEECTSNEPPGECVYYPERKVPNCPNCAKGYYSCSKGVCQPCQPDAEGLTLDVCRSRADSRNGVTVPELCKKSLSYWGCSQRKDNPELYDLIQIPCKDEPPSEPDCGEDLEPKSFAFNKANTDASKIGPFPEDGKVVFFFKSLLPDVAGGGPYRPKISFKVVSTDSTRNGQTYVYTPSADEERKETIFAIKEGEYLLLTDSDDNNNQGSPECAPTENNPKYKSFGWIAPSGGLCGSGLLGPPTEGNRVPYDKPSIAAFRSKSVSQGYKELPKGEQCWADWREWPGDYDFNDYFLMVSYVTEPKSLLTADISVEKSAIESCINEETENPEAELAYSITITNKGGVAGTVSKVVDTLDSKVVAGSVSSISDSGSYSEGKITWNFTPALSLDANGGKKVLTYKVKVAKENFGEYKNVVVVTTSTGEVTAEYSIVADCIITTPDTPDKPGEKVPQTGLFDLVLSRIAAGVILVIFGVFVYNIPNTVFTFHYRKKKISYKYREKFEKRMTGN
ncbi:MAG: hypothetical protein ACOX0X_02350 [Candidatus Dojkabacteria bacterium]|jgi:hypothetical protein